MTRSEFEAVKESVCALRDHVEAQQEKESLQLKRVEALQERLFMQIDKATARAKSAEHVMNLSMTLLDRLVQTFQHELGMSTRGQSARVSVNAYALMQEINTAHEAHLALYTR